MTVCDKNYRGIKWYQELLKMPHTILCIGFKLYRWEVMKSINYYREYRCIHAHKYTKKIENLKFLKKNKCHYCA